jgi:hypothetical protein
LRADNRLKARKLKPRKQALFELKTEFAGVRRKLATTI